MAELEEPRLGSLETPSLYGGPTLTDDDDGVPTQEPDDVPLVQRRRICIDDSDSEPDPQPQAQPQQKQHPQRESLHEPSKKDHSFKENISQNDDSNGKHQDDTPQQNQDALKRQLEEMKKKVAAMEAQNKAAPKARPKAKAKVKPLGLSRKGAGQNKLPPKQKPDGKTTKKTLSAKKKTPPPKKTPSPAEKTKPTVTPKTKPDPNHHENLSPSTKKLSPSIQKKIALETKRKTSTALKKQKSPSAPNSTLSKVSKPGVQKRAPKPKAAKPAAAHAKKKKSEDRSDSESDLSASEDEDDEAEMEIERKAELKPGNRKDVKASAAKLRALDKTSKYLAFATGDSDLADDVNYAVATLDPLYSVWEKNESEWHPFDVLVIGEIPRRTSRVLEAIAAGKCIVSHEWLRKSISQGKWIPYEKFESDVYPGAKIARSSSTKVFGELRMGVRGETKLPTKDLKRLIELCGGRFVTDRCDVIVEGTVSDQTKEMYRSEGAKKVTEKWMFDSIAAYEQQQLDDYKPGDSI